MGLTSLQNIKREASVALVNGTHWRNKSGETRGDWPSIFDRLQSAQIWW
jgi:hypothetical protein